MSYARFGWGPNNELPGTPSAKAAGASSVYLFDTQLDGVPVIECCMCLLAGNSVWLTDLPAADEHLDEHRAAGHTVHRYTDAGINRAFRTGAYGLPKPDDDYYRLMSDEEINRLLDDTSPESWAALEKSLDELAASHPEVKAAADRLDEVTRGESR